MNTGKKVGIIGLGKYLPDSVLTNKDLEKIKKDFRNDRETLRKKLRAIEKIHNEKNNDSWEYF